MGILKKSRTLKNRVSFRKYTPYSLYLRLFFIFSNCMKLSKYGAVQLADKRI